MNYKLLLMAFSEKICSFFYKKKGRGLKLSININSEETNNFNMIDIKIIDEKYSDVIRKLLFDYSLTQNGYVFSTKIHGQVYWGTHTIDEFFKRCDRLNSYNQFDGKT